MRLPDFNKFGEVSDAFGSFKDFGKDDLGIPSRFFHGEEANIAGDSFCDAAHVADDPFAFVGFAREEVDAVLHSGRTKSLKRFAQEGLVFLARGIIGKHHEHGGQKG